MQWRSPGGLRPDGAAGQGGGEQEDLRLGVRGETYADWYLRRLGYVFVARNDEPARERGELDLAGFDAKTLAFVEVRTRRLIAGRPAQPELSISKEKHQAPVRTAHAFLRERHVKECPVRFDLVAIDNTPGQPPVESLDKDILSPRARFPCVPAYRRGKTRYNGSLPGLQTEQAGRVLLGVVHCRSYARIPSPAAG